MIIVHRQLRHSSSIINVICVYIHKSNVHYALYASENYCHLVLMLQQLGYILADYLTL